MKLLANLSFVILVTLNLANGQTICDSICIANVTPGDLFPNGKHIEKNPVTLAKEAADLKAELEHKGVIFDINCEYPSFWIYVVKDNKLIKKVAQAKAKGTAIKVLRDESCDIHKENLAVEISYNGESQWAVSGYDGDPVFLDRAFINLIVNRDYWCDGLPQEPTIYHTCQLCGKRYSSQLFKSKIGDIVKETTYYSGNAQGGCIISKNKNHDNLGLIDTKFCPKQPGIEPKRD